VALSLPPWRRRHRDLDLKQAIAHVRPAVVQIDDSNGNVIGSGFLIDGAGHVATAWHVVENLPSPYVALAQPNTENMRGNFSLVSAGTAWPSHPRTPAISSPP
jgi:S1-C subfamily serine protease